MWVRGMGAEGARGEDRRARQPGMDWRVGGSVSATRGTSGFERPTQRGGGGGRSSHRRAGALAPLPPLPPPPGTGRWPPRVLSAEMFVASRWWRVRKGAGKREGGCGSDMPPPTHRAFLARGGPLQPQLTEVIIL